MSELSPSQKLDLLKNKRAVIATEAEKLDTVMEELGLEFDHSQAVEEFDKALKLFVCRETEYLYHEIMQSIFGEEFRSTFWKAHYLESFPELESNPLQFDFVAFANHVKNEWKPKKDDIDKYIAARDIRCFFGASENEEITMKKGMMKIDAYHDWDWGDKFGDRTVKTFTELATNINTVAKHFNCEECLNFSQAIQLTADRYGGLYVHPRSGFADETGELTMFKNGKLAFLIKQSVFNRLGDFMNQFDGFKTFF